MWRSASASGDDPVNHERARDALELAERALAYATRAGATEAEALVIAEDAALTRFANSQIHQNVAETNITINLRFVAGKRVGVASSDRTDDEGLDRLAERAAAIASVVEELDDWAGLPEPTQVDDVAGAYAAATGEATPEFRAEGARALARSISIRRRIIGRSSAACRCQPRPDAQSTEILRALTTGSQVSVLCLIKSRI